MPERMTGRPSGAIGSSPMGDGPKECPNSMKDLTQTAIIGIDVSRDWLDTCLVPSERQYRIPNTPEGHRALLKLAQDHAAIVCFESTGGLEWKLWQALAEAGVAARQVPPAQGEPLMRLPVICATGPSNHWRRFKHNGERLRQKLRNLGQDRPGRCHHNPALKAFADRLKAAGKPHKVIITAVARKLITIANAICKKQQNWAETPV